MALIAAPLLVITLAFSAATGYLLLLLGAATRGRRAPADRDDASPALPFAVLIPAHNEEAGIAATVRSVRSLDYPADACAVIVIADNCTDATAERAAEAGATVWERHDPTNRGKGHALAWAIGRVLSERPEVAAIAVFDADCFVSPNVLRAMERRFRAGARAVQVNNVVLNYQESWSAALRYAAFCLRNTVRSRGKETLRLSAGLNGLGMAFASDLLREQPWTAFSVAEDSEYHARLVAAGTRVVYAPEAAVRSAMPASLRAATAQHRRWEGGKWRLAGHWAPRLLLVALRRRSLLALDAVLELTVPPLSLLGAGNIVLLAVALIVRWPPLLWLALANVVGQGVYVLGGLLLVRAPAPVYRALLLAPALVLWKLWLHASLLAGRGPRGWVRTEREVTAIVGEQG